MFKRGFTVSVIEKELIVKEISFDDFIFLKLIKAKECVEKFIFGNSFTEGFNKTDAKEKPFFIQQFIHHFKLELFWAIFPTLKCIAILIPSIALLYSTSAIKFFDFSQHFTGHQWFWDHSSLVPFNSQFNDMLFLSKGYNTFDIDAYKDPLDVDFFFKGIDPLFKYPNLFRIMNPNLFFNWQPFSDSVVQRIFREDVLDFFFLIMFVINIQQERFFRF